MPDRVVVRVPATVANLGPGFDCLGVAIAWHNEVTVERAGALRITAAGAGAAELPRDGTNLVARAVARTLGDQPVAIHQMIAIPPARGFGSSAAAAVAGLLAGAALAADGDAHAVVNADLLDAAVELEGHADNAGPCLLGGITVAGGGTAVSLEPKADLRVVACVAPDVFATGEARALLADPVARADAVENIGRTALLAVALSSGRNDLLLAGTDDRLHQSKRFELMPASGDLVVALRDRGIAAFLSGAGPSVCALVPAAEADDAAEFARSIADGWDVRIAAIDPAGATVVEAT